MKEIEERIFSRYKSRIIVILDCCYSGRCIDNSDLGSTLQFTAGKDKNGNDEYRLCGNSFRDAFREAFKPGKPQPRIFYLTASTGNQMSYEYDPYQNGWNSEKYGAFTYQVLRCWGYDTEGMKTAFPTGKAGSRITLGDMYSYMKMHMSRKNREKSTPSITRSRCDVTVFDFSP